jgi:hypothetical protein
MILALPLFQLLVVLISASWAGVYYMGWFLTRALPQSRALWAPRLMPAQRSLSYCPVDPESAQSASAPAQHPTPRAERALAPTSPAPKI